MQAAVDIGNSRIKVGLFLDSTLKVSYLDDGDPDRVIPDVFQKNGDVRSIIVSSVNKEKRLDSYDIPNGVHSLLLDSDTAIPITNSYGSPESLGHDRIALAVAAHHQYPNNNVLIIDMGTCVTMDVITDRGMYLGGRISPGVTMRYEAMHKGTARLPLISFNDEKIPELIGTDTVSCMESGVVQGMIHELSGAMDHLRAQFDDLKIMLTGGDHKLFDKALKNSIFADSNAVLRGLNQILLHNFPNE